MINGELIAIGSALTVGVGLLPITYEPFVGPRFVFRLFVRVGLIVLGVLALGSLGAALWSTTAAAALAIGVLGIAIGVHHSVWAAANSNVMFLWPGVAAAGCGLTFADAIWSGPSLAAHSPLVLVGLALFGLGFVATFFNLGSR